jgi:hypothetical protein
MKIASFTLALTVLLLTSCGGSSGEEGGACETGADCGSGLFCFVESENAGTCQPIPLACAGAPDCSSGCFDDYRNINCPSSNGACVGVSGAVTLTCSQ